MFRTSIIGSIATPLRVPSKRQIKRIKNHPAKFLYAKKQAEEQGIDFHAEPEVAPLKYEPTYVPEKVSFNGWSPAPEAPLPGIPFNVRRTAKGLQLPVYRDYKNGNTRIMTLLRRYDGDVEELKSELSKVCGGAEVNLRPGRMEIQGDHATNVKSWLVGLGF